MGKAKYTMARRKTNNLKKEDRKTERLLGLWHILSHGRSISREEVEEQYHVDGRTVSRYLKDLREFMEQMEKIDGISRTMVYDRKEKRYRIEEMGSQFISNGELLGICKILLASRAFKGKTLDSLLERLLQTAVPMKDKEQIRECIKKELFGYVTPKHKEPDMETLWHIAQAVDHHHILKMNYRKIGANYSKIHHIRPLGVFFSEYYFYLVGWPLEQEDWGPKNFYAYRLDRITQVEETGEDFQIPYADRFQEGTFKNRVQYMFGGEVEHMECIYKGKSIEALQDRLPTAEVKAQEDGSWYVKADIQGEGILMWLLSQGSQINVLKPEKLRNAWLEEARKICEMGKM